MPQQVDDTGEVRRSWQQVIQDLNTARNKVKIYEEKTVNQEKEIDVLKKENAELQNKIVKLKKAKKNIKDRYNEQNVIIDRLQLPSKQSVSDTVDGRLPNEPDEELNRAIVNLNLRVRDLMDENDQLRKDLEKYAQKLKGYANEKCPVSCTKDVYFNILNNEFNESVCSDMFCTVMHDKLKEKCKDHKPLSCETFVNQLISLDLIEEVDKKNDIEPGEHDDFLRKSVEKLKGVVGMLLYSGKIESKAGHCIKVPGEISNFDVASFFDVQKQKPWDGWEEKDVCNVFVYKIKNEAESFKNIVSAAQDNEKIALNQTKKYFRKVQPVKKAADAVPPQYS